MNTTKHTPIPWHVAIRGGLDAAGPPRHAVLIGPKIVMLDRGTAFDVDDAAFIVQAVNAHDLLVELVRAQDSLLVAYRIGSHQRADSAVDRIVNARAALKLAGVTP